MYRSHCVFLSISLSVSIFFEFADDNFILDENGIKFSGKRSGKRKNYSLWANSSFSTVFAKELICQHIKTSACLGKGQQPWERKLVKTLFATALPTNLNVGVTFKFVLVCKCFQFGQVWYFAVCKEFTFDFRCLQYKSFENCGKKEKLLVTSNFFFFHSVFYPFRELSTIFIKFEIVVCYS